MCKHIQADEQLLTLALTMACVDYGEEGDRAQEDACHNQEPQHQTAQAPGWYTKHGCLCWNTRVISTKSPNESVKQY